MKVNCENPRIIINPNAPSLILKYKHWFINGTEFHPRYYKVHMSDFDYKFFSPKRQNINLDNIDNCYIVDDVSGETFPLYLAVPCGHCDICKKTKMLSFVKRCEYESQCYNYLPWFVTFTYEQQPHEGVSVRDCQLFLKRFRINLKRAGFDFNIRYVMVAEYGHETHRAHYHGIFWGINCKTHEDFNAVKTLFCLSWKHGFIRSRLIQLQDPKDKGLFYTAKYLKKDCVVPEGMNDTFVLSSRKNGGIGAPFIDKHILKIRKSLNVSYKFRNKWNGKVEDFMWSTYVINRIFPSFCRSCSRVFRNAVHDFLYDVSDAVNLGLGKFIGRDMVDYAYSVSDYLSKYMFVPASFSTIPHSHGRCDFSRFEKLVVIIKHGIEHIDFELFKSVDLLRHKFLGRLFMYYSTGDFDVMFNARKAHDMLSWSSERTINV